MLTFVVQRLTSYHWVQIAFAQITAQRTSWMNSQTGNTRSDYQRITNPVVQDEEDGNAGHDEGHRAFLPQLNTQSRNDWEG